MCFNYVILDLITKLCYIASQGYNKMKTFYSIILFSLITCTACNGIWNINNEADIQFNFDISSTYEVSMVEQINGKSLDNIYATISIINAKNDTIIATRKETFSDDQDEITTQFSNLPLVGKEVYASLDLVNGDSRYKGESDIIIIKSGVNNLQINNITRYEESIEFEVQLDYSYESIVDINTYNENDLPILLPIPIREGFSFDGWFEFESVSDKRISDISSIVPSPYKLYAKWIQLEENEYSITYHNAGNHSNPTTYTSEKNTFGLTNANKDGYIFEGWYDNSEFEGITITEVTKGSTGNLDFYAKWTLVNYSIIYHLNNSSNNPSNPSSFTIESNTIILNDPTREGYTFEGWYNNSSYSNDKFTKISKGSTGDLSLYAKWTPTSYNIIYNVNNGINSEDNPSSYTIESATITLKNPTRDGYTFDGWYLTSDYTGNKVTNIATGSFGNKELYAKWIYSDVVAILTYEKDAFGDLQVTGMTNAEIATSVIIPDTYYYDGENRSVTSIYDRAFYDTNIRSVIIPNSVTEIGVSAFYSCDNLTSLQLGTGVARIGSRAFQACTSLTEVVILTLEIDWATTIETYAFEGCVNLQRVDFGEKINNIGAFAFKNCSTLTDVGNIPKTLSYIGQEAFMNALNSSSSVFYIPSSVEEITVDAFDDSEATILIEKGTDESKWSADWNRGHNGSVSYIDTLPY